LQAVGQDVVTVRVQILTQHSPKCTKNENLQSG